jgi:hypothetical protein
MPALRPLTSLSRIFFLKIACFKKRSFFQNLISQRFMHAQQLSWYALKAHLTFYTEHKRSLPENDWEARYEFLKIRGTNFLDHLIHSCSTQREKLIEKRIFNFHPRESVETQNIHFMYLTLKQGGKIFSGDTVNVESLISLGRIFIPNFIDFKKYEFS